MRRRQALSLSALLLAGPLLGQTAPGSTDQPAAPSDDLKRMRSLLEQMQTNLVYLPSGYSAMKHQFELEIDMWRMLLERMERAVPPAKAG
ncbi:MAG TPA: hypothetical protein VEG08_15820 [Terriglobales bacterium]|nr:hypothetical protein [Terriglobales bacterium]